MRIRWLTIFLDFPEEARDAGVAFWCEATASRLSAWRGAAGEFATLLPAHGDAWLRVQQVRDGNGGCHLDLHVDPEAGSLDQAAARAGALGAHVRHRDDDLIVADSPGGFTFCLVPWAEETAVPGPVESGPGGVSRADQLCLDIPPDTFEAERSFWASLTGWTLRPGARPEFAALDRPAQVPARLLLQRRDTAAPRDPVSAHIDFACSDPGRLAAQHAAAGARIDGTYPYWVRMTDPTGRPYCLTMRDPGTGKLPPG